MSNPKDLVGAKKAPLGLVPPALEIGASEAMENGANKYGPFNWREKPVEYMTYLVAMKRHIAALIDGEDFAADSGIHHLHHIAAGAGILIDAKGIPGDLIDNRPPKGPAAAMLVALDKSVASKTEFRDPELHPTKVQALREKLEVTKFLCGHRYGDEPLATCGSAIHWSRVNGVEYSTDWDEQLIVICEDSGNHTSGRHLLSCPDFHQ